MTAFGPAVLIKRRVLSDEKDAYGNDVYQDVEVWVKSLAFAPGASSEKNDGRTTITTQPTVYLSASAVLDGLSAVSVDGITYEVDGTPKRWRSPYTGRKPGVEVALREVTG